MIARYINVHLIIIIMITAKALSDITGHIRSTISNSFSAALLLVCVLCFTRSIGCVICFTRSIICVLCFIRSDVQVVVDVLVPKVNASNGVFVAARVDQGGCTMFLARGVFFFLVFGDGHVVIATDLGQ